ncbi:MAG: HAD family phosphatase [Planctomycetota bacterium]
MGTSGAQDTPPARRGQRGRVEFEAIVFDMDGLLVDSEPVWKQAEHALVHDHGAKVDAPFHLTTVGLGMLEWAERVRAHYGLTASPQALSAHLVANMLERIPRLVRPRPGAPELVAASAAGPRAIASSSPTRLIELTLETLGWTPGFPTRCSAQEVARGKPAPDVYLLAAERLRVDPARCLALEDSPTGARAARAAGMTCWAVPDPTHSTPASFAGITPHVYPDLGAVRRALGL